MAKKQPPKRKYVGWPGTITLLEGARGSVERVWHETEKGVYRVTYYVNRDTPVRSCQACISRGRFLELSNEDMQRIKAARRASPWPQI